MLSRGLLRSACRVANLGEAKALQPRQWMPAMAYRRFGSGGDPRAHLNPDGTRPEEEDAEDYHDPDPTEHFPRMKLVKERGQTWVVNQDPPKPISELYFTHQEHVPFYPRQRILIWTNYKLLMKAEYLFFYIPTIIILGLCIPAFTTIYALEEAVASTMTVKVVGRQWYWVYEVESPTDDGDDDDE
mmetsp:Transcript_141686/g.200668  ORF Transcript_141686/g.200668 Transcript_141686/m.200668 type:complete len:186 (-) Transcript_141686:127-684(-)